MFKIGPDGIIVDAQDERPVAVFVDSFTTALGIGPQADVLILRLHRKAWRQDSPVVPRDQVHQFALPARQAAELGHLLLALAAQVEKESSKQPPH